MDVEEIRRCVRDSEYVYSRHADVERLADDLTFAQVQEALLGAQILESYPDKVVLITVYVPRPPKFSDPWTRGRKDDDDRTV